MIGCWLSFTSVSLHPARSLHDPTAAPRADASPALVLVIVCAGVVLASLDLFIVNVALPDMGRDLHHPGARRPLLGAQRLRDRVRGAARAVRPPRREPPPRARLPARRARVHARLGRVRRREQSRDARRLPGAAGRGRGAAHPRLAVARARHHGARAPPRRGARVDGRRRPRRRARPGRRRPARGAQLALGVPRQRARRRARADRRLAAAARGCRGTPSVGPTRSPRRWSPPA